MYLNITLMCKSYKLICLLVIMQVYFSTFQAFNQDTRARVENVDYYFNQSAYTIEITYDIVKGSPVEKYEVEVFFIDADSNKIELNTVAGDIGLDITSGEMKKVVWDVFEDVEKLSGNIKAIVRINSVTKNYMGPKAAVKSVLIPGLGDRLVKDPRDMIIKPYYRTIVTYGFLGYGLYNYIQAEKAYDEYLAADYEPDYDRLLKKANDYNHDYYIYTAIGATLWTADIIWVLVKGIQNNIKRKEAWQTVDLEFKPVHSRNMTGLSMIYRF